MRKVLIKLPTEARHPEASLYAFLHERLCVMCMLLLTYQGTLDTYSHCKHSIRSPSYIHIEVLISVFIGNWKGFLKICTHILLCMEHVRLQCLEKGLKLNYCGLHRWTWHNFLPQYWKYHHASITKYEMHSFIRTKETRYPRLHEHIFSFLFKIIIKESAHVIYMLISSLMILERKWMRKCTRMLPLSCKLSLSLEICSWKF